MFLPGVVGQRVVVVEVVDLVVVVGDSVVAIVCVVSAVAAEVEASKFLMSIFWPIGGSEEGHPVNSVVVFTLKIQF